MRGICVRREYIKGKQVCYFDSHHSNASQYIYQSKTSSNTTKHHNPPIANMKLSALLPAVVIAAAPALACLETIGSIDLAGNVQRITAVDNGVTVCDSDRGHRIDQDGHISVTCNAGFVYAVTKDGSMGWYKNPKSEFSFRQVVGGSHQTLYWNEKRYGC